MRTGTQTVFRVQPVGGELASSSSSSSVVGVVMGASLGVRKRTLHGDLGLANAASATVGELSEVSAPPVPSHRQGDKAVFPIREHLRRRPDGIAVAFR